MSTDPIVTISDFFAGLSKSKLRKVAVNAGLGCPNRDGKISTYGCSYCNNSSFNPSYALTAHGNIYGQLEAGIKYLGKKAEGCGFLAYFQSFSNTYGDTSKLINLYEEALSFPGVEGLVIATRPDCLKEDLLDWFERRFGNGAKDGAPILLIELGVESTKDETLTRINRGHNFECARKAILELDRRGLKVGVHLILGLPGENMDDYIDHARKISQLPVSTLKLHQLQVIKGTQLEREYLKNPELFKFFSADEYISTVISFLQHLRPDIALDRFVSESPSSLLIAPRWGLKPSVINDRIISLLR